MSALQRYQYLSYMSKPYELQNTVFKRNYAIL